MRYGGKDLWVMTPLRPRRILPEDDDFSYKISAFEIANWDLKQAYTTTNSRSARVFRF